MKPISFLLGLFMVLLAFSCKEDTIIPDTFGSVFGEVLIEGENTPVVGATISTNPPTSTILTDAQGRFALENIQTGTYTLRVEKEGYNTGITNAAVFDEQTTNVVIRLDPDTLLNTAPLAPFDPIPTNGSTDLEVELTLSWSAEDPDDGADLTFDIMLFDADQNLMETLASNYPDTLIEVSDLKYATTYYWQVIVDDGKEKTNGEVWSFTTQALPELRFLYTKISDGNYNIYASDNADIELQLTDGNASNFRPRLSPLRDKIAYISNQGIEPQIFVMNRDGSEKTQVTTIPIAGYNNLELDFCWSPDGSRLLYMSNTRLYSINIDGTGIDQIGEAPVGWTFTECDWTEQGNLLLVRLTGANSYNSQMFTMDLMGNYQQVVVADVAGSLGGGVFSIDGKSALYTMDVSGFESPDGRQIDSRIFIKNLSTQSVLDISTEKPAGTNDLDARFAPDGASIIFVNTNNDGISPRSIWKVDLDGENRTLLFEEAEMPEWK